MRPFFIKLIALPVFVILGCDAGSTIDSPASTGTTPAQVTMALAFQMQDTMTACGEATGIRVTIRNGNDVRSCDASWSLPLIDGTADDAGDHHVADCFFVVAPGAWSVDAVEVIGATGKPLECCTEKYPATVTVSEGATSEFAAELSCDLIGNGAIDIYGWLNRPPIIKLLDIIPSKFTNPCLPVFLRADGFDREGDAMSYTWSVVSAPQGGIYGLWGHKGWATFVGAAAGTYQLMVTVTDEHGLSTDLTFPIHVVVATGPAPATPQGIGSQCCATEPAPPADFELPAP